MSLLKKIVGDYSSDSDEDKPEFKQIKKYRICIEDNPDTRRYRCGKKDVISPDCKLTLSLEGLTHQDVMEIDLEIRNMLDRDNFEMR